MTHIEDKTTKHSIHATNRSGRMGLRTNFAWTLAGNGTSALCQWGTLVVLAKLGNPALVGQFALGLAVTAPVVMFANLNLRSVQATDAARDYRFGDYMALRLLTSAIAFLVIGAIVLASGYSRETAAVILIIGLTKTFDSLSDIIQGLLQQREKMDRIAISGIAKGILSLAALAVMFGITHSLPWAVATTAGISLLVLLTYDRQSISIGLLHTDTKPVDLHPRPHWDRRVLTRLTILSAPLGIVMLLLSLNANVPRYFVERHLGMGDLGIFVAMAYLMGIGSMVVDALGQAATPRLALYYSGGQKRAFLTLLTRLVVGAGAMGMIGVAVAVCFGKDLLTILYRPDYAQNAGAFAWLMVAAGIGYMGSFLGYGITATRAFSRFTIPYAAVTAVAVVSSALLIPTYRLTGAAWTICLVSLANCVAPCVILFKLSRKGKMA